jgi:hypothetical protein
MSLDPDELRRLRGDLRSVDPAVRAGALVRLQAIIGEGAREVIAEALVSENPEVRERAELLLARLEGAR